MNCNDLQNAHQNIGSGMIGELTAPDWWQTEFLAYVKDDHAMWWHPTFGITRETQYRKLPFLEGSGSFAITQAKQAGV